MKQSKCNRKHFFHIWALFVFAKHTACVFGSIFSLFIWILICADIQNILQTNALNWMRFTRHNNPYCWWMSARRFFHFFFFDSVLFDFSQYVLLFWCRTSVTHTNRFFSLSSVTIISRAYRQFHTCRRSTLCTTIPKH